MSLTCECNDDYDWYYDTPNDYSLLETSRRKRCVSCAQLINIGAVVTKFTSWRRPTSDIEERIYGDEVRMAAKFMCEECSDLFFSLHELGFCITISDSMHNLVAEYREIYG